MLPTIHPNTFLKKASTGRTSPCIVQCSGPDDVDLEVYLKLKAGCDIGDEALANEALAALLAVELELPVPTPYVVEMDSQFAQSISDSHIQTLALKSVGPNFGSKRLPSGYGMIPRGFKFTASQLEVLGDILAFDCLIENADRRNEKPNMLYRDPEFAIFDHEMAFAFKLTIGWKNPWEKLTYPVSQHVLYPYVRGQNLSFGRLTTLLKSLDDKRLEQIERALPRIWVGDNVALQQKLRYIEELVQNVDKSLGNVKEALR